MPATMKRLDMFDWIGVVFVTFLGVSMGAMIAGTSDLTLNPILALIFPGLFIGIGASKLGGAHTLEIVSASTNGAIYGLLLYGWNRFVGCAPKWGYWLGSLAHNVRSSPAGGNANDQR